MTRKTARWLTGKLVDVGFQMSDFGCVVSAQPPPEI
jgi:hypothetical protein